MTTQDQAVELDDVAYGPSWATLFTGLFSSIAVLLGAIGVLCIAADDSGILASFALLASPWLLVFTVAGFALLVWAQRVERLRHLSVPRPVVFLVVASVFVVAAMFVMGQIRYGWGSVIWF
ncbi:hypothetical protein ABLG96_00355 [Nakamurella sp. A5-74]|uniref:Uncharacterized protein n=1 Tax=Nakamurella sp. A5-74 TaxID=3158264 RepID=A0AAU8DNJ8_9ACTN